MISAITPVANVAVAINYRLPTRDTFVRGSKRDGISRWKCKICRLFSSEGFNWYDL